MAGELKIYKDSQSGEVVLSGKRVFRQFSSAFLMTWEGEYFNIWKDGEKIVRKRWSDILKDNDSVPDDLQDAVDYLDGVFENASNSFVKTRTVNIVKNTPFSITEQSPIAFINIVDGDIKPLPFALSNNGLTATMKIFKTMPNATLKVITE